MGVFVLKGNQQIQVCSCRFRICFVFIFKLSSKIKFKLDQNGR